MATQVYATDLATFDLAEGTAWVEPTASGWTSLGTTITTGDTDDFIQGTQCNSGQVKTGVGGLLANFGSGVTIPTDGAILQWCKYDAAGGLDLESAGGIRTMIGNALNVFYAFSHLGSDTYPYGGWVNLATGDPASVTPDYTVGSPNTTKQYTGFAYNAPVNVPSKGNPYKADAIRYGRCEARITGGDATFGYTTFLRLGNWNDANSFSFSGTTTNTLATVTASDTSKLYIGAPVTAAAGIPGGTTVIDITSATAFTMSANATATGARTITCAPANRFGLFQLLNGSYIWKGLLTFGYSSACDFRDSNRSIVVANTKKVTANFNKIEVRQSGSRVDWTNISINALGTVSRGRFECIDDADVNFDGCTFTDMGTWIFKSVSTILNTTFRRCDKITTGGATFTGCLISNSNDATVAMTVAEPANAELISNTDFISTGTGHGLEITGTAANMTFTNNTWAGYAASDGSTGNEAVYVNIGSGSMNLTISGGTTPSIRTAGAAVTVISGAVSASVHSQTVTGTAVGSARVFLKAANGTGPFPFEVTVTIVNSGTTATVTHASHGLATNDKILIDGASHWQNRGVFSITVTGGDTYTYTMPSDPGSSPTGVIKATFVVIEGLTNGSGDISMSRVFASAQPVTGWARKSSSAPFYKPAPISGSVSSTLGFSATAIMVLDE